MLCFSFEAVNGIQPNNLFSLNSIAAYIALNKITAKRCLDIINDMKIDRSVVLLLLLISTNYFDRTEKETTA